MSGDHDGCTPEWCEHSHEGPAGWLESRNTSILPLKHPAQSVLRTACVRSCAARE
ncbi:hypothetical protein L810_5826 [Burkholderia sp. AU4i]|nr:hypothetical protein L810_5826 [Burkholderia sp. AU4i]